MNCLSRRFMLSALLSILLYVPAYADFAFVHVSSDPSTAAADAAVHAAANVKPQPAFVIDTMPAASTGLPAGDVIGTAPEKSGGSLPVYRLGASGARHISWDQSIEKGDKRRLVHFILLNNSLPGGDPAMSDPSLVEWLRSDLAKLARPGIDDAGTNTPVVLAMTRALSVNDPNFAGNREFLSAIAPYNVRLILTNGPSDASWNLNGVPVVALGGARSSSNHLVEFFSDRKIIANNRLQVSRYSAGSPSATTRVLASSLQRPFAPAWTARINLRPGENRIVVAPEGDVDAAFEYSINNGPYRAMTEEGKQWSASVSPSQFRRGENLVVVRATFPDRLEPRLPTGRDYYLFVPITVSAASISALTGTP